MSTRIDDTCLRQYQLDEGNVPEVIWHLVDKETPVLTVLQGVGNVTLTQLLGLSGI